MILALVPLLSDIPVIILIWLVMRQFPDWALNVLRLVGGLFYLYLAYGLIRNVGRKLAEDALATTPRRTFGQAITAVWVTPNVYINWSVIGVPALIGYAQQSFGHAAGFLLGFYLLWVGGLAMQIILIGQAGKVSSQANRYLIYAAALLLVGFGIYLISDGATRLWAG